MLVIADATRAVAVAGVMGGANSEVRDSTRTVLPRERVLRARLDPPDREGARALHRGLLPLRARRGHRGAPGRAGPGRAADRRAGRRAGSPQACSTPIPRRAGRWPCRSGSRASSRSWARARPARWSPTSCGVSGFRRRSATAASRSWCRPSGATSRSRTTSWRRSRASGATRRSRRRSRRERWR